ncbi:hypothetical protein BKA62DRAFT_833232 [Auriculariales sp. MPI-PUGE-AT-0066]|nr:hypothetical protein BKA62DRAFT_833232 [Auriculariales sp. MPI-PUGE-AT-0066]
MVQRAVLTLSLLLSLSCAALQNITIDDTYGDEKTGAKPSYTGGGEWHARSSQTECSDCSINPDPKQMLNQTWHDATTFVYQDPSMVKFNITGSAVYIFCILAGGEGVYTQSHLSLEVDGIELDTFDWKGEKNSPEFQYKQLVLAAPALQAGTHSISVVSKHVTIGNVILASGILFDYAIYSGEDTEVATTSTTTNPASSGSGSATSTTTRPTSSENASPNTHAHTRTIGLAVGLGLGAFITFIALLLFLRSRRALGSVKGEDPQYHGQPYTSWPRTAPPASGDMHSPVTRSPPQATAGANIRDDKIARVMPTQKSPPPYSP